MRRFGTDVLREVAQLHRKDQELEGRLHDYDFPLTHVEPLPEAEHRLFEYLFDRQPDNEHFSYSDPTPLTLRAKDDASAKRRAETPGRELLDLFAENAAMHAFSDAVARGRRELDDRLELWDGPSGARRGGAAALPSPRARLPVKGKRAKRFPRRLKTPNADLWTATSGWRTSRTTPVRTSPGETRACTIGPPLNLDPDDPDEVWFVGEPRAETRAAGAVGAVGADDASANVAAATPRNPCATLTRKGSAFWERLPYTAGVRQWRKVGAVVSALEIDRAGAFTCPVSAGAVFFSPGPPARLAAPRARRARLRRAGGRAR